MRVRTLLIIGILVGFNANLYCQSLEKQIAVFFDEEMSESQKREFRIVGKRVSANDFNINSNTVYQGTDGRYYPESGYNWKHPHDPNDYLLIRLPYGASLPSYDIKVLREAFEDSDSIFNDPKLTALFTYKYWQNTSIKDRSDLDEFHGVQRTFNAGETVKIAWSYAATGVYISAKQLFTFTVEVFNFDTGEMIASKRYRCQYALSSLDRLWNYYTVSLGNKIPPGNYRINLNMERAFYFKPSAISLSFFSERFEVLPMMPQNQDLLSEEITRL